jgi:hypothetical protein
MTMYNNLLAEMARYGISKNSLCKLLDISASTLRYKIGKQRTDFTVSEMWLIYDTYFKDLKDGEKIEFEYLCKTN